MCVEIFFIVAHSPMLQFNHSTPRAICDTRYAILQWSSMSDNTILLLGGAGLVGLQVARAVAREIEPRQVVIASLFQKEVREALALLKKEFPEVDWVGEWGDGFLRT